MCEHSDLNKLVQEILSAGLLRIRSLAWAGDSRRCAIEADHIHNLPHLLVHEDPEGLIYYWEVERPSYIAQAGPEGLSMWEPLWQQLQAHVEAITTTTSR